MLEAHRAALAVRQPELTGLIATLDAKILHYRDMEVDMEGKNDDGPTSNNGGRGRTAACEQAGGASHRHG
ncbi:MerR family transcriptional regulator [Sphingomonas prati]|uniref:Uncharacterized protein n=1 Tax=Sphingomonas prati TaxID=1843237 RepID=A0A7W9BWA2_9SPHN|nr:hypothetical protein [Sphingomonas prati]MBB5730823.1 hypothetical protein [Sphingomonas prati]GGE97008.1 hypothetical protein GCM10011404_32710 [Sphingomonas prati]